MFGEYNRYIASLLTGFLVTYFLTPWVRSLAARVGMVDLPNERRPHKTPTARGGGIAVVLGVQAACFVAYALPWPGQPVGLGVKWWGWYAVASTILAIVGLIDDKRGMPPLVKLGGQALAALIMSIGGLRFGTVLGYAVPWWLDCFLVVFWIVAAINAFNLIDGLDGLASGLAFISAVGLAGVILLQGLHGLPVVLALAGACLAFLRYNFYPATIFLGDTGSMFLGFTLGVISLQTVTKSTFLLFVGIPLLVLGIPIYDALLAIWRRSIRAWLNSATGTGKGGVRGIMQPDVDHLHHRLVKAGFSTRRVATTLYVGNAALVVFGLAMSGFQSHAAGIFLIAFLAGAYFLMRHLALIELRDTGTALLHGLRRPPRMTGEALAYPIWDMFFLCAAVALDMWLHGSPRATFWRQWFFDLPVWVTPTFLLLAISRVYVTRWSRARPRDFFTLGLTLYLGLAVSLALALLIDPYNQVRQWFVRALIVGAICHPTLLGARMIFLFAEELVSWARRKGPQVKQLKRVALYGAGARCRLYTQDYETNFVANGALIVGIFDDDPALQGRWVYGHEILGTRHDLARLIEHRRLAGLIITADLPADLVEEIKRVAAEQNIDLTDWRSHEHQLHTAVPGMNPQGSKNLAGASAEGTTTGDSAPAIRTLKGVPAPEIL